MHMRYCVSARASVCVLTFPRIYIYLYVYLYVYIYFCIVFCVV